MGYQQKEQVSLQRRRLFPLRLLKLFLYISLEKRLLHPDFTFLQSLILSCELGLAAIVGIHQTEFVVCLFADETCEIGMLKKKARALANALQGPLTMMD